MDVFGFGTIVPKIEEYFGRRVYGFLLIVPTVAALIVCANPVRRVTDCRLCSGYEQQFGADE